MRQLLVIGNGVAGVATVERILEVGADLEITVFGTGSPIRDLDWYQRNGIGLQLGVQVTEVDPGGKTVTGDDGSITPYDTLVLATGTAAYVPPIVGLKKRNVFTASRREELDPAAFAFHRGVRVVVISESLSGLEMAAAIRAHVPDVTLIIDTAAAAVKHNLDPTSVRYFARVAESRGVRVLTGRRAGALVGNGQVECVDLDDSSELPADVVVIASSLQPDVQLARRARLNVNRGIVVDDRMRTSDPDIFAAGECVEHRSVVYGPVSPLLEQARVAASQIAGDCSVQYEGSVQVSEARILDVDVFSAGTVDEALVRGAEVIRYEDPALGIYRKVLVKDNHLAGVILLGDASSAGSYAEWLRNKTDLTSIRRTLLLPADASA